MMRAEGLRSNGNGEHHSAGENEEDLGAGRASYAGADDLDTLERRRTEELRLISKFDTSTINPRRESWFLVDTKWLERWAKFVRGECAPPGRISNANLLQADLRTPRENLRAKIDYRGVNPIVWFLYVEMYGKDEAPEICRYVIDIYELEVPGKYKPEIISGPSKKAKVEVQKMRWRVEPPEVAPDEQPKICGCITEAMIDCFFMNLFTCCRRGPCCDCCRKFLCCFGAGRSGGAAAGRYKRVAGAEEADESDEEADGAIELQPTVR